MGAHVTLTWPHAWWARVTISNPTRMNAMNRDMWVELPRVFDAIAANPQARAVELVGDAHGKAFCSGGDISEYPSFRFDQTKLTHFHEELVWPGLRAILACDLPVVANISNTCMGAGLEVASCADIRLANLGAKFGAPIAKLGFPMAPKEAAIVAHALGDAVARNVLLLAAVVGSERLLHTGFLSHACPADALDMEVFRIMHRLVKLSPQAGALNKQGLRARWPDMLQHAVGGVLPIGRAYAYADSDQHREGIDAFLAKRPPQF